MRSLKWNRRLVMFCFVFFLGVGTMREDIVRAAEGDDYETAATMLAEQLYAVSITEDDGVMYYKFVPEESGTYIFYSEDDSEGDCDPYAYLYDETYEELADDDDGGESLNFSLEYDLVRGNVYYLVVRAYDAGEFYAGVRRDDSSPITPPVPPPVTPQSYLTVTGQTNYYAKMDDRVTFRMNAHSSNPVITYEWYMNKSSTYLSNYVKIEGVDTASYTVNVTAETGRSYQCIIKSGDKTVTVNISLSILYEEQNVKSIRLSEDWQSTYIYEQLSLTPGQGVNGQSRNRGKVIVTYDDGTEESSSMYSNWIDFTVDENGNPVKGKQKAYVSCMGKTISYDAFLVSFKESGRELQPGEKISGQTGQNGTTADYYYITVPYSKYAVKLSGQNKTDKGVFYGYDGRAESSRFTDYQNISSGYTAIFGVESVNGEPFSYEIVVDTLPNISETVLEGQTMEKAGYYKFTPQKNGLYEIVNPNSETNTQIGSFFDSNSNLLSELYEGTKCYLTAETVYYIECIDAGGTLQMYAEKTYPAGMKAGGEQDVIWSLAADGTLTFEGTGEISGKRKQWISTGAGNSSSIKKIVIGNGITAVGDSAFYSCAMLEEIQMPDSMLKIGNYAFYNCTSLASITLPGNLIMLGDSAFAECSQLSRINTLDASRLTSIGGRYGSAFSNTPWEKLQAPFILLDSVLVGYKGNEETVTLPDMITQIGDYGFYNSSSIKTLHLNNKITRIGSYGVGSCRKLEKIEIPGSVTEIAYGAFDDCSALEDVVIKEGVKEIGEWAFFACNNLKSITIPNSVTKIQGMAIGYDFVGIRPSITRVGNPTIYCQANSAAYQYAVKNGLSYSILQNGPSASSSDGAKIGETYTVHQYTYKITGNTEAAFAGVKNTKAATITIPSTVIISNKKYKVTGIASGALQNTKVKKVKIGENVTAIGSKAFYSCKKLTSITIPKKVKKIGKQAFYNCKALKKITVKTTKLTKKSVGSKAFKGIYAKAQIKVPRKKFKAYQKLLKEKGAGQEVKFKK